MRVISGRLGGRTFQAPAGHRTHPMGERVRGALFNTLGDIEGLSVLDAFAGSGALSIESISRGASHAVAVDIDKNAHGTITENVKALGISKQVKVIRANASGWSDNNQDSLFDIVIAAPPYDNLQHALVAKLTKHVLSEGLYVLDWPGQADLPQLPDLRLLKQYEYGDAQLVFYRKL